MRGQGREFPQVFSLPPGGVVCERERAEIHARIVGVTASSFNTSKLVIAIRVNRGTSLLSSFRLLWFNRFFFLWEFKHKRKM